VPYEDPQASAAEIRKRAGDPNFCQVLMMSRTAEPAGNPRYWPIYEAAAEAGLPVAFHAFGYSGWAMTNGGWPSFYIEEVSEHATSCQNQVISLVVEGVFERFPTLKIILIECGFAWLPSVGWRLDQAWKSLKSEVPHLTRLPSEQIRQHIWVSTQPMEEPERGGHLLDIMEWVGWDRILFASDYPHWDFDDARSAMPGVVPAEKRAAIYGGNARALYGLGRKIGEEENLLPEPHHPFSVSLPCPSMSSAPPPIFRPAGGSWWRPRGSGSSSSIWTASSSR
jgi:uncharacterized protein